MNRFILTVIIAPLTSKGRSYPTSVECRFDRKPGQVVVDQIRTVDKARLIKKLGRLDQKTQGQVLGGLAEMFSPWTRACGARQQPHLVIGTESDSLNGTAMVSRTSLSKGMAY